MHYRKVPLMMNICRFDEFSQSELTRVIDVQQHLRGPLSLPPSSSFILLPGWLLTCRLIVWWLVWGFGWGLLHREAFEVLVPWPGQNLGRSSERTGPQPLGCPGFPGMASVGSPQCGSSGRGRAAQWARQLCSRQPGCRLCHCASLSARICRGLRGMTNWGKLMFVPRVLKIQQVEAVISIMNWSLFVNCGISFQDHHIFRPGKTDFYWSKFGFCWWQKVKKQCFENVLGIP